MTLRQAHAQRQLGTDRIDFFVQRFAQVEPVPALAHDHAQQQRRLATVADNEGLRVFIASLDRGDVRQLQGSALRHDRRVADLLQFVECAVQADENFRPLRFHGARRRQRVLGVERGEYLLRADAQRCQSLMRELHIDPLGLFADDIDLLDTWHVQQPLAQPFRIAHQQALRFALRLERVTERR